MKKRLLFSLEAMGIVSKNTKDICLTHAEATKLLSRLEIQLPTTTDCFVIKDSETEYIVLIKDTRSICEKIASVVKLFVSSNFTTETSEHFSENEITLTCNLFANVCTKFTSNTNVFEALLMEQLSNKKIIAEEKTAIVYEKIIIRFVLNEEK